MRSKRIPAALVLCLSLLATPAHAAHWDLIYVDHFDVTLCNNGCGITLAGQDFGIIVNTGTVDLTNADLFNTTFTVQSSVPAIELLPFINNPGPPIAPIHPGEAAGSVSSFLNGSVLLTQLHPTEIYHNTTPDQFIAFEIVRNLPYDGPVRFDITMNMGGESAHFSMFANVTTGPHALTFTSAARVASSGQVVAALQTSWGAVKARYR